MDLFDFLIIEGSGHNELKTQEWYGFNKLFRPGKQVVNIYRTVKPGIWSSAYEHKKNRLSPVIKLNGRITYW
jgi:hypothetical protein